MSQRQRSGEIQSSFAKLKSYEKLLLILTVVLALVAALLFQSYRKAQASQEKLRNQLVGVERGVDSLKKDYDLESLRKKQADLVEELAGGGNPWSKKFSSLDIDNLITNSAVQNKVEVLRLNLGKDTKKKIGNIECQIELRQVEVRGELANIVRFIDQIERGQFPSLRMDNIKIGLSKGIWNCTFDLELWYLVVQGGSDVGTKG